MSEDFFYCKELNSTFRAGTSPIAGTIQISPLGLLDPCLFSEVWIIIGLMSVLQGKMNFISHDGSIQRGALD